MWDDIDVLLFSFFLFLDVPFFVSFLNFSIGAHITSHVSLVFFFVVALFHRVLFVHMLTYYPVLYF